MRVFIAIDLSPEAKKEIEKFYKKVLFKKHWPVKWEKPEKLHLTLVFLGEIKKTKLQPIKSAIKKVIRNFKPFLISFKGLGCWPEFAYPRVIWLGLKGDLKSLAMIQKNLEKELIKIGFNLEIKPFSPHITLGRIKNECEYKERIEIGRQLRRYMIYDLGSKINVDKIVIYESKLKPTGSVYKRLLEIQFAKNFNWP